MPSVETFDCTMDAVLWKAEGTDNFGEITVNDPVSIKTRFTISQRDGLDPNGNKITFDAWVAAKRAIPMGSIIREGLIIDIPSPITDLYQVKGVISGIDIKNRSRRFEYGLMRFKDKLPDLNTGTGT